MDTHHERGIAIVLALFLMSAMSVLAASLMFLSQTETYASMNYRMMSQARYAGEAGVQKAANFLLDSTQYAMPGSVADPLANYDTTKSPVVCVSGCPNNDPNNPNHWVILSGATASQPSNYPAAAVQTAFDTAAHGTLMAGTGSIGYSAYATLLTMQKFDSYGGGQAVVQTWQVTGIGSLSAPRTATVEVVAMVETPKVPASSYGAFATDDSCGALTFQGSTQTKSYDSTTMTGATTPTNVNGLMSDSGGDVGTNGNLSIGGSVDIHGNLYTPRAGVGTCAEGAVTALSENNDHASVSGSIMQLPADVKYPDPPVPAYNTNPLVQLSSAATACADLGLTAPTCTIAGSDDVVLDAYAGGGSGVLSLPSVKLTGQTNIIMVAHNTPVAEYNFNSIEVASQSAFSAKATSSTQGVLVNVVGKDNAGVEIAMPIDMQGGSFAAVNSCSGCSALCATCSVYDASILQFVYAGTGEVKMKGNSGAAATFYAPNASIEFGGTSDLYGSILGNTINETGTGNIYYDRRLSHDFYVPGHPMASTFNWKRY